MRKNFKRFRMNKTTLAVCALATVAVATTVTALVSFPKEANAHPVFARQYGMSCAGCHYTPITTGALNSNGHRFRNNGYRFGGGNGGGGGYYPQDPGVSIGIGGGSIYIPFGKRKKN